LEGKRNVLVIVLIIIVAILTIAVSMLAGYLMVFSNSNLNNDTDTAVAKSSTATFKPNSENCGNIMLFENSQALNLKYNENEKPVYISMNIELQYYKNIKNAEVKINNNLSEIRELVSTYFQKMTLEEAKAPETKDKARKELTEQINKLLSSETEDGKDLIYTVIFERWLYQ